MFNEIRELFTVPFGEIPPLPPRGLFVGRKRSSAMGNCIYILPTTIRIPKIPFVFALLF